MSTMNSMETTLKAGTGSRGKTIAYWTVTGLFAASMTISGIGQLMELDGNVELVKTIGYPMYILTILGIWKLFGAVAIVVPGLPRVKEWAYAGFFFLLTGAFLSHVFAEDYGFPMVLPLMYVAFTMASWALRPLNRKL